MCSEKKGIFCWKFSILPPPWPSLSCHWLSESVQPIAVDYAQLTDAGTGSSWLRKKAVDCEKKNSEHHVIHAKKVLGSHWSVNSRPSCRKLSQSDQPTIQPTDMRAHWVATLPITSPLINNLSVCSNEICWGQFNSTSEHPSNDDDIPSPVAMLNRYSGAGTGFPKRWGVFFLSSST